MQGGQAGGKDFTIERGERGKTLLYNREGKEGKLGSSQGRTAPIARSG